MSELGLLLLDERMQPHSKLQYPVGEETKRFLDTSSGVLSEEEVSWLKSAISPNAILLADQQMIHSLAQSGIKAEAIPDSEFREIGKKKVELIVGSGLAGSPQQAEEAIRNVSIGLSTLRIREMSAKPDLQAMESVQALDEIDRTSNTVSARVREWYGLHFPELTSMVDDNISLTKLVLKFKSRNNYDEGELEQMGYSKNKSRAILSAAQQSRGAELREEDIARIVQLAEEAQHLFSLRDKLASHVERTMRQVAPNVSEVAGASIGARLVARAGGLEKLAIMPASTIQILGAEKALYRALKTGSRPPKHGILVQHAAVHSAPKWQRGKIARSIAGKIAIAARVDAYRGSRDESVSRALQERLDEIKVKYKEAPKEKPPQFVPQRRRPEIAQVRGRWDRGRKQRKMEGKPRKHG